MTTPTPPPPANGVPPVIAAVLRPDEKTRVEAASNGWFSLVHKESVPDAIRAVRERPVDAVLLSVHHCRESQLDAVSSLIRGFPGIPTVALVSRHDPEGSTALLQLGATGVRQVIDVTAPDGWHRLRQLLGQPATRDAARIQGRILATLGDATPDALVFFEALARLAPDVGTARAFADALDVPCTTLMSRFMRAGLPSPKNYLAAMRIVHATALFARPGFSVSDVAYRLDYSSPQSFGRHVRALLGITCVELRQRYTFDQAVDRFIALMVTPHVNTWREFRPLSPRRDRT